MSAKPVFLDHDLLVAYVDGELPRERAAAVEQALVHDAEAWETVRLLRLSANAAARAFAAIVDEPVPARLIEAASAPSGVFALGRPVQAFWPRALAASLAALAIGIGAGYFLRGSAGGYVPANLPLSDPLAARFEASLLAALDKGADGDSFTYESPGSGQGQIRLSRPFTTAFGSDCREFHRTEISAGVRHEANGVACRAADRSWTVMILPAGG